MRRSTSTVRRLCAVGTTIALVGLTTGLGIMSASAASAATDPTTSSDSGSTLVADQPSADGTGAPGTAQDGTGQDGTGQTGTDQTGTPAADDSDVPADDQTQPSDAEPDADVTTPPATTPPTTTKPTTTKPAAADVEDTDVTVTISGTAKIGSQLVATPAGFGEDSTYGFVWTDTVSGAVLATVDHYTPVAADAGRTLTVTVTGQLDDGTTAKAEKVSDVIAQDPVFVGPTGKPISSGKDIDDPLYLEATAGDAFSYTFRAQGTPAPTYELAFYWDDEEESADSIVSSRSQAESLVTVEVGSDEDEYTPADQLPDGVTFDAETGVLSGTPTLASWYDFAITATSGQASTTQYVELTVDPGAAVGIAAYTIDKTSLADGTDKTIWVISPDGEVFTITITLDEDGFPDTIDFLPTGRPTVKQGGTLLVSGYPVDRFGNEIDAYDDEGNSTFVPTVTSDVSSDVIAPYTTDGLEGQGVVGVTFPHASVHTLTVSAPTLTSTSFAVEVQPTAVTPTTPPVAVVGAAPTGGQLAYTGTDSTDALPWALGLLAAGAALIGARAVRRRRAQR